MLHCPGAKTYGEKFYKKWQKNLKNAEKNWVRWWDAAAQ